MIVDAIGYAGAIVGTSMMVPQVIKLVRMKKSEDVSLITALVYCANCVLWFAYGMLIAARPVIVANSIGFIIGVILVLLIRKYSKFQGGNYARK